MAIIFQLDKRSGITYAYESHSYWDKEKKTSRAKRTLIGRVDPETGEISPTDGRGRKDKSTKQDEEAPEYEKLFRKLEKKCAAQEALIASMKKEIAALKAGK
jgi:hypothetical protein